MRTFSEILEHYERAARGSAEDQALMRQVAADIREAYRIGCEDGRRARVMVERKKQADIFRRVID